MSSPKDQVATEKMKPTIIFDAAQERPFAMQFKPLVFKKVKLYQLYLKRVV